MKFTQTLTKMIDYAGKIYDELDPSKKNYEWCNKTVSILRMYWRPLIDPIRGAINRNLIYSMYDMDKVKKSFQDEDFLRDTSFEPLPIMESYVNTIVEEITKQPPRCEVKAQDPTAINEKDADIMLLKNRKILERDISKYQQEIGLPEYKMPYDKFNGNVKDFDDMGLDDSDPEDVNVYAQQFQRLHYEIAAQAALNGIIEINKYNETTLRTMVKDVMANKALCAQSYVDQVTGELKYEYMNPASLHGIFGDTNDGKNDICRGWYKSVTVMEWLGMAGDSFDFDRDWKSVLWGVNYYAGTNYTGFIRGGIRHSCFGDIGFINNMASISKQEFTQDNLVQWNDAYMFKIWAGYIEWKSVDATTSFKKKGNDVEVIDYATELNEKEIEQGYKKTSKYQQQWYRTYFISTSSLTQYSFGFQKVYFQHLSGANDEYSNGTICYYQEQGKSAAELSETFIEIANFAYYRFRWLLYKVKPDQEEYVLDELITLSKGISREFPEMNGTKGVPGFQKILEQVIETQRKSNVKIRVYPEVEGRKVAQLPPEGKKPGSGGLDVLAIAMQAIMQWVDGRVSMAIGVNPMRTGANPPSRESFASEQQTLQASFSATGYIYRMCQYQKYHLAISTLNYISDIVQYPDTLPYNWLKELLGNETFEKLKSLKKQCAHRMGIFIHDANLVEIKQRVMQAADIALSKGTIDNIQWNILYFIEDPKQANARLSVMQRHAKKRERREAIEMENLKHRHEMEKLAEMKAIEGTKQDTSFGVADRQSYAQVKSAELAAQSKIAVKELTNEAEDPKQMSKAQAQKDVLETQSNLKQQEAFSV